MKQLLGLFRNRNLALLLSARLVSTSGDWLYAVALAIAVYHFSGNNSTFVGLLWVTRLVPSILLGSIAGTFAGRLGYRRAMVLADLGRMVLVGALAFVLTSHDWPVLFPVVFLVTCLNTLFQPANVGLIPSLVNSKEERVAMNASVFQVQAIALIAGSALGGVVAGMGLINQLLFVDALTFGVSALSLRFIRPRPAEERAGEEAAITEGHEEDTTSNLLGGFRLVASRPLLVFAATVMMFPELASGSEVVWLVPYSEHILHLGNAGVGYFYAALGGGALIGGFIAASIAGNIRLDNLLAGSVLLGGFSLMLYGGWNATAPALFFFLVAGLAETVEYVAYGTLLQQAVPEKAIAQASGTLDSFFMGMMLIGNLFSGPLANLVGLTHAIIGLGALIVIATTLSWWNLHLKTARQPDAGILAKIPAFTGVSPSVLEWAVRRMLREQFSPGAVIVRQGDEGDKFYAIASGQAEVEVAASDQSLTVRLGPGDFFGEIALLHNVPRTATVKAIEPLTVYVLSREDFQELQNRAGEFRESLLQVATARLEEDTSFQMALATRL